MASSDNIVTKETVSISCRPVTSETPKLTKILQQSQAVGIKSHVLDLVLNGMKVHA